MLAMGPVPDAPPTRSADSGDERLRVRRSRRGQPMVRPRQIVSRVGVLIGPPRGEGQVALALRPISLSLGGCGDAPLSLAQLREREAVVWPLCCALLQTTARTAGTKGLGSLGN